MVKTNLIIGGARGYNYNQLKPWVQSIKDTGFEGDIILVCTDISKDTIDKLIADSVLIAAYGDKTPDGGFRSQPNGVAPHVERFFYIWNTMVGLQDKYERVVVTDTRDVIFQQDPFKWIEQDPSAWSYPFIASAEGFLYKDEPWSNQNLHDTFGPYFHNIIKDRHIFNVGVIGGDMPEVTDLMLMIFQLSINRPVQIVDQAVYNFLLLYGNMAGHTEFTDNSRDWAIQLGTTFDAYKAGKGDISQLSEDQYKDRYQSIQPIHKDGKVINPVTRNEYVIVHQWDRVPELAKAIKEKYEV